MLKFPALLELFDRREYLGPTITATLFVDGFKYLQQFDSLVQSEVFLNLIQGTANSHAGVHTDGAEFRQIQLVCPGSAVCNRHSSPDSILGNAAPQCRDCSTKVRA
jgi:hypothetical protein